MRGANGDIPAGGKIWDANIVRLLLLFLLSGKKSGSKGRRRGI